LRLQKKDTGTPFTALGDRLPQLAADMQDIEMVYPTFHTPIREDAPILFVSSRRRVCRYKDGLFEAEGCEVRSLDHR
jgi:hypothetical protein